jgi:hypothetical protein
MAISTYRRRFPLPEVKYLNGLGFNLHWDNGGRAGELADIRATGARWVRTDLLWNGVESNGVYNFTRWDKHFAGLKENGLRSVNILCYNHPDYMSDEQKAQMVNAWDVSFGLYGETQINAFLAYVEATVKRYAGQGHIWEFWNEPNINHFWKPTPDPAQFMHVLSMVVKLIRNIAPDEYIAIDASHVNTESPSGMFLEDCIKLGLFDMIDVLFVHPYTTIWNTGSALNAEAAGAQYTHIKKLLAKYMPKGRYIRVFQGECGISETDCNYYEPSAVTFGTTTTTTGSDTKGDLTTDADAAGMPTRSANLLGELSTNFNHTSWRGYWMKPGLVTGVRDPLGLNNAVRLLSADRDADPGRNVSGLIANSTAITGSTDNPQYYVVSYYARATRDNLFVFFGLSDKYVAYHLLDDKWRRYYITFKVTSNETRGFQVYERAPNNVDWEIAYPMVERIDNPEPDTQARRQALQAEYAKKQWQTALNNGVAMNIWYNWMDDGPNTASYHDNFGVLEEDRVVKKPAYHALQQAYFDWRTNGIPK